MGKIVRLGGVADVIAPSIENGKVVRGLPRKRRFNVDVRTREHLTPDEVKRLITVAGKLGRHGHRDSTLLMVAYRHGLRVSELVSLLCDQVDLKAAYSTFGASRTVHRVRTR